MAGHDDSNDDPKVQPEPPEKRPLGFKEEPAAPSPEMPERRIFLKFAVLGAAGAALLGDALHALTDAVPGTVQPGAELDPASNPVAQPGDSDSVVGPPVKLPYTNSLSFASQPGTVSDGQGGQAQYTVSGQGNLQIDSAGNVYLSNLQATAQYVAGALNVGTISVVQPTPAMGGTYSGGNLNAQTMVLYTDNKVAQMPSTFRAQGPLYQGGSKLQISVDYLQQGGKGPDWGVVVSWTKATC